MALSIIRKRLDEDYNALHLLDSLPTKESMTWVPFSAATPPQALVIGTENSRHILAFLMQHGDKPREVRYCSIPINGPVHSSTIHTLLQDQVMTKPLKSPFKYNADSSKSCKRKSSILLKWYFMLQGLWTDGIQGDYSDYCKRFYDALRKIQAGQEAENSRRGSRRSEGLRETPVYVEGSSESDEPRSVYTPGKTPSGGDTDYDKLCRYLDKYNALYLLGNIPDANGLEFADQGLIPEAQPKKLFIGRHAKNEHEIYAYMKPNRAVGGWHEINFWVENPLQPFDRSLISSEAVAKQRLLHPFNKTFPKDAQSIEQGDRARLTLMIKWYFIAAGIAKDAVLKETKAYPERLRSALEYIAARMGDAAVEPPSTSNFHKPSQEPPNTSNSHKPSEERAPPPPKPASFDESHIQSDLAATPQPDSQTPVPSDSDTQPGPSPRGTKRKVEDDDYWAQNAKNAAQERTLTKEINRVDEEIEMMRMRKENYLERYETELKEVMHRRMIIDGKRKLVRKQHSRQKLAAHENSELMRG